MSDILIPVVILAFIAEYVAATVGMGYGTTLAPILIIMGYEPIVFVPAILFSQFLAGFTSAAFHHRFRNMNLAEHEDEREAALIFSIMGVGGAVMAVLANINLPAHFVKAYIAITVMSMGLLILADVRQDSRYSRSRLGVIGVFAAFNKGISGGGYGPVATSGQIVSGIRPRAAIAITALVEGVICALGIIIYFVLSVTPALLLTLAMTIGALVAAPLSALTTAKLEQNLVRRIVALSTLAIGLVTLLLVLTTV
ncbi:MAG: sulfite exporter TauE/SafE family protein [Candidatus Thorarchaeota archaeon]